MKDHSVDAYIERHPEIAEEAKKFVEEQHERAKYYLLRNYLWKEIGKCMDVETIEKVYDVAAPILGMKTKEEVFAMNEQDSTKADKELWDYKN